MLLALTIVAGGYACLFLAAILAQSPVRLIDYKVFGLDFNDFWTAANDGLAGRNPYLHPRFVTPPASWLPFAPLAGLTQPVAASVFFGVNLLAMVIGLACLGRRFALSRENGVMLGLLCALSPSTLMLLDRGNIDGLVFVALCGFVLAGADAVAGPLLLAVASILKLYPAVFLVALAAHRHVRGAVLGAVAVLASAALMPSGTLAFVHNQIGRAAGMRIDENLSGLAWFWLIDRDGFGATAPGLLGHPALLVGTALYTAALAACLWIDSRLIGRLDRPTRALLLASYAAFCVSMPSLVYLYSGVSLFILAAALGLDTVSASPRRRRRLALALGITMVPAKSFALTLGTPWAEAINLVPPAASLLLIVEVVLLRVDLRQAQLESPPGPGGS